MVHLSSQLQTLCDNGAEGEAVNPAPAAALFCQRGSPGNGGGNRDIVQVIFLLKIGSKTHQQKADHGNLLVLAEGVESF